MKALKLISSITAVASAAAMLTAAVSAYDFFEGDLGQNWSINKTVPASEFADLTADSYVTITFETDKNEPAEGHDYYAIKPMDSAWTWIDPDGTGGAPLTEGKDAYQPQMEDDSITFKVSADFIDALKEGGMILLGHRVTLKTLTVSNEAPAAAAPADTEPANEDTQAPADTQAAGDTNKPATADKSNADTGVEGVAIFAAVALIAGTAVVISRKRK